MQEGEEATLSQDAFAIKITPWLRKEFSEAAQGFAASNGTSDVASVASGANRKPCVLTLLATLAATDGKSLHSDTK